MKRYHGLLLAVIGLMALAVAMGTGLAVLYWQEWASPAEVSAVLEALKPWFFGWRLLIFGGLMLVWDRVVSLLAQGWHLNERQTFRLLEARWQVALWLVALELTLGQNIVGRFLGTLGQGE